MRLSFHHHRQTSTWIALIKVVIAVVPVMALWSLLNANFVFTPTVTHTYRPDSFTKVIAPVDQSKIYRTSDKILRYVWSQNSLPFHVLIPRLVEGVRIRLRLTPGTQPYAALRAQGAKGTNLTTILSSKFLDELTWSRVTDGTTTLWQKTATYRSLDEFRSNPPDLEQVAGAGLDLMAFARIKGYAPASSAMVLTQRFRGSHQFYIYAGEEPIGLSLDKIDLNRSNGGDGLTIRIARADTFTSDQRHWQKTVSIGDDGNRGKKGPFGQPQHLELKLDQATPGVYLVDVSTGDDVTFTNLSSSQEYLSFTGRVFLAEGPAYGQRGFTPVVFTANAGSVSVAAQHDQGKQTVNINGRRVSIQDLKTDYTWSKLLANTRFDVPKGDVVVSSDGLLSIGPAKVLPDGMKAVDLAGPPSTGEVNYIVANYQPRGKGPIVVEHEYRLADLALGGKTLSFAIDTPGMQGSGATMGLRDLRVTFIRGDFPWDKVWKKLGLNRP